MTAEALTTRLNRERLAAVTSAIRKVKKTTGPVLGVLEKIAAETEKTQQGIQQLSGDIKTTRNRTNRAY